MAPTAASVGTSGSALVRFRDDTASGRIWPAAISGMSGIGNELRSVTSAVGIATTICTIPMITVSQPASRTS